jgi:hypothetical protein
MGLALDGLAFVSATAAEIDRLVVRGHERAGQVQDRPPAVAQMTAFPQLLSTAAIVLLEHPLTRADISRIVPYTPQALIDGLIDNNVGEGIVSERDGALALTEAGRAAAEGVVAIQEGVAADMWSSAGDEVQIADRHLGPAVHHARTAEPIRSPSNFELFAACCDRPTIEGRVLRLITSVRYLRADAHARALTETDLQPFEAHALNRLWDTHRGVDRVGQGFAEPGRKGVASLERRGLAEAGAITDAGIDLREQVERRTDELTAPVYDPLDEAAHEQLLAALRALPD